MGAHRDHRRRRHVRHPPLRGERHARLPGGGRRSRGTLPRCPRGVERRRRLRRQQRSARGHPGDRPGDRRSRPRDEVEAATRSDGRHDDGPLTGRSTADGLFPAWGECWIIKIHLAPPGATP